MKLIGIVIMLAALAVAKAAAVWRPWGDQRRKALEGRNPLGLTDGERERLSPQGAALLATMRICRRQLDLISPAVVEMFTFEQRNAGKIRGERIEDHELASAVRGANEHLAVLDACWQEVDRESKDAVLNLLHEQWSPPGPLHWDATDVDDLYENRFEEIRALAKALKQGLADLSLAIDGLSHASSGQRL